MKTVSFATDFSLFSCVQYIALFCYTIIQYHTVYFGSFQLSANGQYLLYTAEKWKPSPCSFFKEHENLVEDTNVLKVYHLALDHRPQKI